MRVERRAKVAHQRRIVIEPEDLRLMLLQFLRENFGTESADFEPFDGEKIVYITVVSEIWEDGDGPNLEPPLEDAKFIGKDRF